MHSFAVLFYHLDLQVRNLQIYLQDCCYGEDSDIAWTLFVLPQALPQAQLRSADDRAGRRKHTAASGRASRNGGAQLETPLHHPAGIHSATSQNKVRFV